MDGPRKEFELSADQYQRLLDASKPTPAMYLSGGRSMCGSPAENAERAWREIAAELGFIWDTAKPVPQKTAYFVSAVPA